VLGNMTVIESQDSKDATHTKSPFHVLPLHKLKGYLYIFNLEIIYFYLTIIVTLIS